MNELLKKIYDNVLVYEHSPSPDNSSGEEFLT